MRTVDPSRRPLVLIVDDHVDTTEAYAEFLSFSGFTPLQARNGADGFALACNAQPDVVITDVMLSGAMNGLDLTSQLRGDLRTADVGIIALTGRSSASDREEARRAGCDVFLTKPCTPDALLLELRRVLTTRRGETPVSALLS